MSEDRWLCDFCGFCKKHCICDHYSELGECEECEEDESDD